MKSFVKPTWVKIVLTVVFVLFIWNISFSFYFYPILSLFLLPIMPALTLWQSLIPAADVILMQAIIQIVYLYLLVSLLTYSFGVARRYSSSRKVGIGITSIAVVAIIGLVSTPYLDVRYTEQVPRAQGGLNQPDGCYAKENGGIVCIEEEGILLIKRTPEYNSYVDKYGSNQVSVKAVNLHDEGETAFLKNISDGFREQAGCIIVMNTPNGEGYVYQLDEEFNIVFKMTLYDFEEGAINVDAGTMELFYSSLK